MKGKKFFTGLVFCVLLAAVYVVADFTLRTESGDLVLDAASGKVSVNTSNPSQPLTVVRQIGVGIEDSNDAYARGILLESKAGAGNGEASGRIFFSEHNNGDGVDNNDYGLSLYYQGESSTVTFDSGASISDGNAKWGLLRHNNDIDGTPILSGSRGSSDVYFYGDVGIGTASPDVKLDVNGNIDLNGYKITAVAELNGTGGDLLVTSGKNTGTVKVGVEDALRYYFESSMLRPAYDNTYDLGSSSYAWRDIYYEGSLTDTDPTLSRENIIDLTGKTPLEIVSEIEHSVDGHLDLDSLPDFLKPCVRYSGDREEFKKTRTEYYTVTFVEYEDVTETYEFVDEEGPKEAERVVQVPAGVKNVTKPVEIEYYDTTELEDVELCEKFGEGIKIDEYTNLVALAVQEQNQIIEDLTARIEKLEEAA